MRNRSWTDDEIKKLKDLRSTHSVAVIASKLGRSRDSVSWKTRELLGTGEFQRGTIKAGRLGLPITVANDVLVELPQKYLDILRVTADKVMSFSDVHLPFIDWDLFFLLMRVAKTQAVKTCIIGGDLFDFKQFSTFPDAKADKQDEMTMAEAAALKFFNALLAQFEKIYVICGNHDFRVVKWSQGLLNERQFFRFLSHITDQEKRVQFSAYHHLILNGNWRIVHPNSAATNFEAEGRAMAAKYQQSIIMTHVHRVGCVVDSSGKYCIVGNGALIDPTTQAYIMTIPSKYPMWNTGATIIHGDVPYLFPKFRTDWDIWTHKRFL